MYLNFARSNKIVRINCQRLGMKEKNSSNLGYGVLDAYGIRIRDISRTVCDELSANLHAEHTSEYIICRDAHCLLSVCMIVNTNIAEQLL